MIHAMDDRDNIRHLTTASKPTITRDDLRALLDSSEDGVLRQAALDVEDDLASFELRLADLPERSLKRLVGARAVARSMMLGGHPSAAVALADFERILCDVVDAAWNALATKPPKPKRTRAKEPACSNP